MDKKSKHKITFGNIEWIVVDEYKDFFQDKILTRLNVSKNTISLSPETEQKCKNLYIIDNISTEDQSVCFEYFSKEDGMNPKIATDIWDSTFMLENKGFRTLKPIAYGVETKWGKPSKTYLIREYYPDMITLKEQLDLISEIYKKEPKKALGLIKKYSKKFGEFFAKLHKEGICYHELCASTIQHDPHSENSFVLDNLANISFKGTEKDFINELAHLLFVIKNIPTGIVLRFFSAYKNARNLKIDYSSFVHKVNIRKREIQDEQVKKVSKVCFESGDDFQIVSKSKSTIIHHKDRISLEDLNIIMTVHDEIIKCGGDSLMKSDRKVKVTRVDNVLEYSVCVKEFIYADMKSVVKNVLRESPARRAWRSANQLEVMDVNTPTPLALIEDDNQESKSRSLFLTRFVEATPLNYYFGYKFNNLAKDMQTKFLNSFADFIIYIFEHKVFHKDLKSSNILVSDNEGFKFLLIDLESAVLGKDYDILDIAKRMAELNMSIPLSVFGLKSRLIFIKNLVERIGYKDSFKSLLRSIVKQSEKRNWSVLDKNKISRFLR